jgi:hypothetical protein
LNECVVAPSRIRLAHRMLPALGVEMITVCP